MAESESKTWWTTLPGIITGIAGLIAAIASLLAVWPKPNPKADDTSPKSHQESPSDIQTVSDKKDASLQDEFSIVAISPQSSQTLNSDQPFEISMRIHYRLVSADEALFVTYLELFQDQCASQSHETIASGSPNQIKIR